MRAVAASAWPDDGGRRLQLTASERPPECSLRDDRELPILRRHDIGEGRGGGPVHDATLTMFAGVIEWYKGTQASKRDSAEHDIGTSRSGVRSARCSVTAPLA